MSRIRSAIFAGMLIFGVGLETANAAEVSYDLSIVNGKVSDDMRLIRVKQNDVVRLRWSTDKPVLLHLHGYDIMTDVEPGAVSEVTFTARATGRFQIEPHLGITPTGGHVHGDVLATIEVYP